MSEQFLRDTRIDARSKERRSEVMAKVKDAQRHAL